jgi:hypothetical protein
LEKKLELDCSFDKDFMLATGIFHKDSNFNYRIEKFLILKESFPNRNG